MIVESGRNDVIGVMTRGAKVGTGGCWTRAQKFYVKIDDMIPSGAVRKQVLTVVKKGHRESYFQEYF